MIQFKVGNYYRYTGPDDGRTPYGWNTRMRFVFDREPHLCLRVIPWDEDQAQFENPNESEEQNPIWHWGGDTREYWEEVTEESTPKSNAIGTKIIFERRK